MIDDDPIISEAIKTMQERVRTLREQIHSTHISEEHAWFQSSLVGILNSALHDYHFARMGIKESVYLAAWATRNLLELKTVTDFLLHSKENAESFKTDLLIDAKQFYESVSKNSHTTKERLLREFTQIIETSEGATKDILTKAYAAEVKNNVDTTIADEEAAEYKKLLADLGIKDTKAPKLASSMAQDLKKAEEFAPMNKVLSKVMHRTSLSIASTLSKDSLSELLAPLETESTIYLMDIYSSIKAYIEKNEIKPPSA